MSPFRLIRLAWHSLRLLHDPTHLDSVFGIVKAVSTPEQMAHQRERLRTNPRAVEAMDARRRIDLDVDRLGELPEGTLGRAFADFCRENEITPETLTAQTVGEDEWVAVHMYETHDLIHVLIGADTDTLGELYLQSFMSAQMPWEKLAPVAIGVGFFRAALGHAVITPGAVLEAANRGSDLGYRAEKVFGFDWEAAFARPLDDVRRELGILEVPAARAAA